MKVVDFTALHGAPAAACELCVNEKQARGYNQHTGLQKLQWLRYDFA